MGKEKICKTCHIVFVDLSPRGHAQYCSRRCYQKSKGKTEEQRTKICCNCNKTFVDKAYANNSILCSKECKRAYMPNRIKHSLRSRLNHAINKDLKTGSAVDDLGCTIDELKLYLESKFSAGMTWNNWSRDGWHIDHIIPLSSFDLTDSEQLKKAIHYTNLQPLWAEENCKKDPKRKKYEQEQMDE